MSPFEYSGPERRRRVAYMTRNTEYHLDRGVCVAVRDRTTGNWQLCHGALGRRLAASLRRRGASDPYPTCATPEVGDALFFAKDQADGSDVLTSDLLSIERPPKSTIAAYPV